MYLDFDWNVLDHGYTDDLLNDLFDLYGNTEKYYLFVRRNICINSIIPGREPFSRSPGIENRNRYIYIYMYQSSRNNDKLPL